jgi:uroporphyrin-III C-methyltransferase/precorrin-2 dehydrogenase/sirohydrochlorin ferrochelatase
MFIEGLTGAGRKPMQTRTPTEVRLPRMLPLARLPVFLSLNGERVVVAGGSPAAAWKAELLSAAGARVDVYAPEPGEELLAIANDPPQGEIVIHSRRWAPDNLIDAAIAVGACADDDEAADFASAARACGVPVNVIDRPNFCDFAFGAIVNRSPLVIGVSTDGAAPVFGQAIRAKIEAIIPLGFARWAAAAQAWRAILKQTGLSFEARRRFWRIFATYALNNPRHEPELADYGKLLARTRGEDDVHDLGSITLVGAGPGDPELLTLRAVRALQSADVILIDDLVSDDVIDFARREAKKMMVGKSGFGPSCRQDEINALMITLARSGKRVVRLKGGDPTIFGRAGEEIEACREAGIPVEVVPGITAAQGVARSLAISLTHRRNARRLQYITGHGENGKLPDDIEWESVVDPAATTIVYMPKKTLGELMEKAISHGLDRTTPAAVVIEATRPGERIITGNVADIASRLEEHITGPATVIVGKVLGHLSAQRVEPIEMVQAI